MQNILDSNQGQQPKLERTVSSCRVVNPYLHSEWWSGSRYKKKRYRKFRGKKCKHSEKLSLWLFQGQNTTLCKNEHYIMACHSLTFSSGPVQESFKKLYRKINQLANIYWNWIRIRSPAYMCPNFTRKEHPSTCHMTLYL